MPQIKFTVVDSVGDKHFIEVTPHAYRSLMDLIVDRLMEDIGDCRGRAWCGTCIVKQISGKNIGNEDRDEDEEFLLNQFPNPAKEHIRLACQIEINQELENTCWEVVESRLWV